MARKIPKPVLRPRDSDSDSATDYPSLNEHRASRRRFLQGSLAVMGAGALATACPGFIGQVAGGIQPPDYFPCRFPQAPDDRAVWLMDGAYARFYVVALTYHEDVAFFAEDQRAALTDRLANELAASTYDELSTPSGHAAASERLRALLDDAYNENTGDIATGWFETAELTLTVLNPPELLAGAAPEPSYP